MNNLPLVSGICALQVPLVAVDSYFYGKLVIAPLNILLYNVFTPHGPDLYGMFMFILTFIIGSKTTLGHFSNVQCYHVSDIWTNECCISVIGL